MKTPLCGEEGVVEERGGGVTEAKAVSRSLATFLHSMSCSKVSRPLHVAGYFTVPQFSSHCPIAWHQHCLASPTVLAVQSFQLIPLPFKQRADSLPTCTHLVDQPEAVLTSIAVCPLQESERANREGNIYTQSWS